MGYVLFMFTHRPHACQRACASARVVKHALIFGRILFIFPGNILQINISSMGCILITFTHRVHAGESARANARVRARSWHSVRLSYDGFSSNVLGTYYI
jgi:hypothetical protein